MHCSSSSIHKIFFFFNGTATTEIYTLSLHDALPILGATRTCEFLRERGCRAVLDPGFAGAERAGPDRKSTRLNSSHQIISYAVFCLKKKVSLTFSDMRDISRPLKLVVSRSEPYMS